MKLKKLAKSLYWRISISFLLLLLILGLAYVMITAFAADRYFKETTQRLNAHVAESMLLEVKPFINGEVNEEALGKIMHSMMAVNPSLEVYLLSPQGKILSYVVLTKDVKLDKVDLAPVQDFLETSGQKYILGDDPRNPSKKTIFSATQVVENDELMGYVYMVLASKQYTTVTQALINSYWLRVGTNTFLLTLIAALIIGLILIWILTKNLRKIIQIFKRFEEGDTSARIPKNLMKGELADLSKTFNKMADTILNNIEDLKKVDSLRRELIANVSHDLRSPLAVIHGYIETLMMKDDKLTNEQRRKYLQIIIDSSDKLKHMVSDLFELSKLEAKQIKLKKEKFLINELLADTALKFNVLAEEKGISIHSNISKNISTIDADISLMERVIQNLMMNAIKYTPKNGEIRLKVNQENDKIKVDIENTGEGVAEKDIPHLFNRYYKVDKEKSGIQGTGLGLAIVKKILDLHNFTIQVRSKQNETTSFSFAIPLA
jgi:signal transduction histidine kinase